MDRTDPADPMLSAEPADPMDSTEPAEAMDHAEANDSVDRWLQMLNEDRVEPYERIGERYVPNLLRGQRPSDDSARYGLGPCAPFGMPSTSPSTAAAITVRVWW